jgi:hypothetical protein
VILWESLDWRTVVVVFYGLSIVSGGFVLWSALQEVTECNP